MAVVAAVATPITVAVILLVPVTSAAVALLLGFTAGVIGMAAGLWLARSWIFEHA
jgi:hypothetical protein